MKNGNDRSNEMSSGNASASEAGSRKRTYIKYAGIFLIVFLSVVFAGLFFVNKYYNDTAYQDFETIDESTKDRGNSAEGGGSDRSSDDRPTNGLSAEEKQLEEQYSKIKRLNVLVAGIESERTDTLMLFSFDQQENKLDIISVPRDTYIDSEYTDPGRKKINSVYGYPGSKGGITGTVTAVSRILNVPVHEYVAVDYDAVRQIVDAVGGVEVDIPFDMKYDDPYAEPPLHINFKKGERIIDGDEAVEYLRWRKNNNGSHSDEGDIGRIKRQQEFVISSIRQSLNPVKLPRVVRAGLDNTRTSLDIKQALYYSSKLAKIKDEDINAYSIIGEEQTINGLWYFKNDAKKTRELIRSIYNGSVSGEKVGG